MEVLFKFVYQKLKSEPTGHDYLHAMRVFHNAEKLLDYSMDRDIVLASALVHDLIDYKLEPKYQSTKEEIVTVLLQAGLSDIQITHVFDIIENMSYSSGKIPKSMEGKIVQDADRLDALGAIGIARAFSYGGKKERLLYDPTTTDGTDTISHFYQKLFKLSELMHTKQGYEEALKRTAYMRDYIKTLYNEVKQDTD